MELAHRHHVLSFTTCALGLLVLTPIVLNRFSTAEIDVWCLLLTLIGLRLLADFGFSPSFSRAIAYTLAGVPRIEKIQALTSTTGLSGEPNWPLLIRVLATMRRIYWWLQPTLHGTPPPKQWHRSGTVEIPQAFSDSVSASR